VVLREEHVSYQNSDTGGEGDRCAGETCFHAMAAAGNAGIAIGVRTAHSMHC
jgi:hypothetical protein